MVTRQPCAALRPFVELLWVSSGSATSQMGVDRELVLPTGMAHIALRLDESPMRLFKDAADQTGTLIGSAIVGGVRTTAYHKQIETRSPAVGMLLRPGALEVVSGAPASAFAGSHTPLDSVWGTTALAEIVEKLNDASTPLQQLDIVERFLVGRFPGVRGIHPAIAHALKRFDSGTKIADVVSETGFSHRHFIKVFESTVGLAPKRYRRVQRLNLVLNINKARPGASWADIAAESGFADQAHLNREFLALAGVTPSRYRQLSLKSTHHLPMGTPVNIVQDRLERRD